ncbi:phospholipase A2 inhibitor beta-like [Toxorhynchites rutilus septentrionalis]|uniref:phospholipase A2 inhibitor beta-like n=1 Tax=Toxorhynchites rutilus septentrionalis TaxID=329112 RepID=UPI00247ACBDC|nr:phospholipase A2 inhibitor beta-like [Toxorhynchites rutilus septentrionalis]
MTKYTSGLMLSTLFLISVVVARNLTCTERPEAFWQEKPESWCLIEDVDLEESTEDINFPEHPKIYLRNFNVSYLSPTLLFKMKNVKHLTMDSCTMTKFFMKSTLISIEIKNSDISEVIIDKDSTYELLNFSLEGTYRKTFPNNFIQLSNLEEFSIRHNDLTKFIMRQLNGLNKLKTLDLSYNRLEQLIISDGLNIPSLKQLNLAENHLQQLPANLRRLKTLEHLNLHSNQIAFLEMSHFNGLDHLKKLVLSGNRRLQVSTLEPVHLPRLEKLEMIGCGLKELDMLFWKLPSLRYFNVFDNSLVSITNFPESFTKELVLVPVGNRWSCLKLEAISSRVTIKAKELDRYCEHKVADICCNGGSIDFNLVDTLDRKVQLLKYQNSILYAKLEATNEKLEKVIGVVDQRVVK